MAAASTEAVKYHPLLVELGQVSDRPTWDGLLTCVGVALKGIGDYEGPETPAIRRGLEQLLEITDWLMPDTARAHIMVARDRIDFQLKNNLSWIFPDNITEGQHGR